MAESTVRDGDKGIDLLKSKIGQPLSANRFVVEFEKLPEPFQGLQNDYLRILCKSATIWKEYRNKRPFQTLQIT